MASHGFGEATMDQLKVVPFAADSLLRTVVQQRQAATVVSGEPAPTMSANIMKAERSAGQMALPLIASNLLVGALLIDVQKTDVLEAVEFYKEVAVVVAMSVANSILFGRSAYERERVHNPYKRSCPFGTNM